MKTRRATIVAIAVTLLSYVAIARLVAFIAIPPDAPTAATPWVRPFRVVATLGFGIASIFHVPHLAGDLLAAILLGAVLGAVFATIRHLAR